MVVCFNVDIEVYAGWYGLMMAIVPVVCVVVIVTIIMGFVTAAECCEQEAC